MKASMTYRVPYADTDQMGVVYYANYLVYFERVRNEILRNADYPYSRMEKDGYMLPVIHSSCNYKNSAHYDDLLTFKGWVEKIKGARIQINCEVCRDELVLVDGFTIHACVKINGRPTKPPLEIRNLIKP